jgi:hypothetical protein
MAAQKTYGGITQSKIDTMLEGIGKKWSHGVRAIAGVDVDTHQYGIKLKGEWNVAGSSLR